MINRREFHLGLIGAYTTLALAQTEPRPAVRRRVALLIGNGRYSSGGVLKNPPNDAQDVAAALKRCHFDVTCKTDLSLDEFNDAVDGFVKSLKEGDVALFYYAGHGLQVGGANYLIPVDFDPSHGEAKVSQDCIGISELQAQHRTSPPLYEHSADRRVPG